MDLETMWSSVDTEQSDGTLDHDYLRWDLSAGGDLARTMAASSQFVDTLPEQARSAVEPSSYRAVGGGCESFPYDENEAQADTSETASELDFAAEPSDQPTMARPSIPFEQENSAARCPFCGNAPIVPGKALPSKEDRRPVGGKAEKGRYKVRAAPRKENRLAQW